MKALFCMRVKQSSLTLVQYSDAFWKLQPRCSVPRWQIQAWSEGWASVQGWRLQHSEQVLSHSLLVLICISLNGATFLRHFERKRLNVSFIPASSARLGHMNPWATLQEKLTTGWRERERVRKTETQREASLWVKPASFAEKGDGRNFNVVLFLLTGAMSWIFNLLLFGAPCKRLYPRAGGMNPVLQAQVPGSGDRLGDNSMSFWSAL